MIIGIDVDGVLVDMQNYQLKYGKEYFENNKMVKMVNPKGYDICEIYGSSFEEREKFWKKYIWRYCLKEPMTKGAAQTARLWKSQGHKIYIITGRAHTTENNLTGFIFRWMLKHWLRKNHFVYDKIFFCSEKDSSTDKCDICLQEQVDVMIDDKAENLFPLLDKLQVICYPAVWNEDCRELDAYRVNRFEEIEI